MNWQLKSIAFLIQFLFLFVSGDEGSHKVSCCFCLDLKVLAMDILGGRHGFIGM